MPPQLRIDDGPTGAEWNSDAIRIRATRATSLTTVGSHTTPVSGSEYYTYVRVQNVGTDPFGRCTCSTTGAWAIRNNFINVNPPPNGPNGMTVMTSGGFATLRSGTTELGQWLFTAGDFWSWSPDGRFFAYVRVERPVGGTPTWTVSLIATAAYSKTPPAAGATPVTVAAGTTLATIGPRHSASPQAITGVNLGWNPASTCLHVDEPPLPAQNPLQREHLWICPFAGTTTAASTFHFTSLTAPVGSGPTQAFRFVYSPCGDLAAIVPTPAGTLELIDLRTAMTVPTRANNITTTIAITGSAPTLATTGVGRLGLTLTQMSVPAIDNAECLKGGAVVVEAQRVLCSTVTPAMAPVPLASGASAAAIWPGMAIWVEIPRHRFTRIGTISPEHWCLQVRGDGAANGDSAPPMSAFNIAGRHFAQRNVVII